jgi:hypothetical protein
MLKKWLFFIILFTNRNSSAVHGWQDNKALWLARLLLGKRAGDFLLSM